jgi:hypothetical protein
MHSQFSGTNNMQELVTNIYIFGTVLKWTGDS